MRATRTAAVAAALAAVAAVPAAAQAAQPELRTGRFLVQLNGVQTTTWETRHAAQFECDVSIDGSGSETLAFRSKPTPVTLRSFGRTKLLTIGRRPANIVLAARIDRQGETSTRGNAICADGDGTGGAPPAPDCGVKRSDLSVDLRYLPGRRELISFQPDMAVPLGPFETCPVGGTAWPELLTRRRGSGRAIAKSLPVDDLFEHGRNIVVARDTERLDDGESRSTTTIRWSLSFKRLDRGPAASAALSGRSTRFTGRTSAGDRISFSLRGDRLVDVRSHTPTSCVPTDGTPRGGTDVYDPPGRFPLGRTTKVQTPRPVDTAMHYDPVSKWFHLTAKRGKRGAITGTLHQNYAFESIGSDPYAGVRLIAWVCQGDARFTARPTAAYRKRPA